MSIRCEHERFDGKQCSNWAIPSTNPPRCLPHLRGIDRKNYFRQKDIIDSDPRNILREELRIVRKLKHTSERSKLVVEIMKMLAALDAKPEPEPEKIEDETPQQYAARLRGKK